MRGEDLQQLRVCCTFLLIHSFEMRGYFRQKTETALYIIRITLVTCGFGCRYQGGISYSPFVTCQTESAAFQLGFFSHGGVVGNLFACIFVYYTGGSLLIYIGKHTVYVFLHLFRSQVTIRTLIGRLQQM